MQLSQQCAKVNAARHGFETVREKVNEICIPLMQELEKLMPGSKGGLASPEVRVVGRNRLTGC